MDDRERLKKELIKLLDEIPLERLEALVANSATVVNPDGNRGNPNMAIIDESGLYSLVMSVICPSKLCNVKRTMKDMQGFKARMCKI